MLLALTSFAVEGFQHNPKRLRWNICAHLHADAGETLPDWARPGRYRHQGARRRLEPAPFRDLLETDRTCWPSDLVTLDGLTAQGNVGNNVNCTELTGGCGDVTSLGLFRVVNGAGMRPLNKATGLWLTLQRRPWWQDPAGHLLSTSHRRGEARTASWNRRCSWAACSTLTTP